MQALILNIVYRFGGFVFVVVGLLPLWTIIRIMLTTSIKSGIIGCALSILLSSASGCTTAEHERLATLGLVTPANNQLSFSSPNQRVGDDQVIAAIPDLQRVGALALRLPAMDVTDAIIPAVIKVESLEILDLSGTDITIDGLRQLRALPHLKTLWISVSYYAPEDLLALNELLPHTKILEGDLGTRWREERSQSEDALHSKYASKE